MPITKASHTDTDDTINQSITNADDTINQSLTNADDTISQSLTHADDTIDQSLTHADDTINQSLTNGDDTNADRQSLVQSVCTQTTKIRLCDANMQVSSTQPQQQIHVPAPVLCYVPVESQSRHHKLGCEIIKENDDGTKFCTGLASWSLFQFLSSYLITYFPNTKPTQMKLQPCDSLLMVLVRLRLNLHVEVWHIAFVVIKHVPPEVD